MAKRPPHKRLIGNRKGAGPGTNAYVVEIQGANALANHLWAYAEAFGLFAPQILDVSADIGIEEARHLVRKRTWATHDSINKSPGVWAKPERGEWSIRFGPTTFYSPFLEYGTSTRSPYPFMIPAGDMAERAFVPSVIAFIGMIDTMTSGVGWAGGLSGPAGRASSDPRVKGSFTGLRSYLYSTEKALGDIAVFGGREVIGPTRSLMLGLARSLGDVSSIMNGVLGQRITTRLRGRATGRLIGFGSASLSAAKTYSGFPGGEGGHRIYQRAAGRVGNIGISNFGRLP